MTDDDTFKTDDDTVMTHDDSADARVVRHLEPLWWRPSLQLTGLVLLGLGALLGWYVQQPRPTPAIDVRILDALSQDRSPALITLARWIELYDGPKVTPWLLVAALVVVFAFGHRLLAILAVVMVALSWFPGHYAKEAFPRLRPPASVDPVWIVEGPNSYPSGHTGFIVAATIAGVFVFTVLRRPVVRRWWIVGGTLLVLLVGWSRMFVAVHYPTDVVGGALLAGGMALFLWPLWAGLQATIPERIHALGDPDDRRRWRVERETLPKRGIAS